MAVDEDLGSGAAKQYGREVRGFDDARWNTERFSIVVRGNEASSARIPRWASSGRTRAAACWWRRAPVHRIWGIGLAEETRGRTTPSCGAG